MPAQAPSPRRSLEGKVVAITGRLTSMSRDQAIAAIQERGGEYVSAVGENVALLAVGQHGWPLQRDGHLTQHLTKAQALQQGGHPIEVLSEERFVTLLGLDEGDHGIRRLFTTAQLSRILKIETSLIRHWIRAGLITPVKTHHRLCYFDFEQVASAKALIELSKSGVTPHRLRRSLEQLKAWFPGAARSLAQLGMLEEGGRLLIRLSNGQWAEPSGQLQLDFRAPETSEPTEAAQSSLPTRLNKDWFEIAIQHEEAGELEAASKAYHRALLGRRPEPEICFNLGNVLYSMRERAAACQRYLQAVELDPEYVEAWNNLGNVFAELSRIDDALDAYRSALRVEPNYADAHFNLAETLEGLGLIHESIKHWRAYVKLDPHSAEAKETLERLERECRD